MSKLETFEDLLESQVQDMHSAEKQFAQALPKVAEAASDPKLREAIERHAEVTRQHVERVEEIGKELGVRTNGKTCHAAEGLVKEGKEILKMDGDPDVIDAALIGAAQRMEHYEIAAYGTLAALARRVGNDAAARLAEKTLSEEREADQMLTQIAESSVNRAAARS